jgi:hypothetical protein
MKLLLIVVDSNHQKDVETILDAHQVSGYTEMPNVLGKGEEGKKMGSRAFPGSSTLYFAVIKAESCDALCGEFKALKERAGHEEGLKVFTMDAEVVL